MTMVASRTTQPLHNAQPQQHPPSKGFLITIKGGARDAMRLEPGYFCIITLHVFFFYSTNTYLGQVSLQMDMAGPK